MNPTKIALIAFAALPGICVGQDRDQLALTKSAAEACARKVAKIQMLSDMMHEFCELSVNAGEQWKKKVWESTFDALVLHALNFDVSAEEIAAPELRNKVSVYRYTNLQSNPDDNPSEYVVAVSRAGSIYLLSGFGKTHFPELVEFEIGRVEEPHEALAIVRLYFSVIQHMEYSSSFVDSSNLAEFTAKCSAVQPPSITHQDGKFTMELFTVTPGSPPSFGGPFVYRHLFEISETAEFSHQQFRVCDQ